MASDKKSGVGCEHAARDGWHIADVEDFDLFSAPPPRRWTLWDSVSAEARSPKARSVWSGVIAGLAIGIVIQNWFMIGFALFVGCFLGRTIAGIMRTIRYGEAEIIECRELEFVSSTMLGNVWHVYGDRCGERLTIPLLCDELEPILKRCGSVDCKVVITSSNPFAHFIAYRERTAGSLVGTDPPTILVPTARATLAVLGSVALGLIAAGLLAYASYKLGFEFSITSFLIGGFAGYGAERAGGHSKSIQFVAAASAALAYFAGQTIVVLLLAGGLEFSELPNVLSHLLQRTFTSADVIFLAGGIWVAWGIPRGR